MFAHVRVKTLEDAMTDAPGRRFRRPVRQCLNCRRKKQKCDRRLPCNNCIRGGRQDLCEYAAGQEPLPDDTELQTSRQKRPRINREWSSDTESDLQVTSTVFRELQGRVSLLEETVETQSRQIQALLNRPSISRRSSAVPEALSNRRVGQKRTSELVLYQSLPQQFPDLQLFIERLDEDDPSEEVTMLARDLRRLHSVINQTIRQGGNTYTYGTTSDVLARIESILPAVTTCQVLVDLYFDTFENSLRVLHTNTKDEFRAYLQGRLSQAQRSICLPTLLAVISIASSLGISPECDNPILHGQHGGVGAYQLLRNYLALLTEHQWKELHNLQTAVLTLKYHKSAPTDPMRHWQWSGEIVRRAMAAGLNYGASMNVDIFTREIKRRLWLSILELDLTLSIACNMPVTCPTWDHDAPLSVSDYALYPTMEHVPLSGDLEQWTCGSCQHILARSYNYRREAYSLVSSDRPASYQTILGYTRHLEQIIHDLPKVFKLGPTNDPEADSPYGLIAKMELDFLLRRPLNACYAVYGAEFSPDDEYREARIPWMQGVCFNICFQDLFDPNFPTVDLPSPEGLWDFFYNFYEWDVRRFLLASCLELQRLRSLDKDAADSASQPFQGHTAREPIRIMGWTVESITASIDQTIDPMARRLGRFGADFKEVVRWTAVMGALRVNPSCARLHAVKNELQSLVATLYSRHGRGATSISLPMNSSVHMNHDVSDLKWLATVLSSGEHEDVVSG